MKQEITIQIKTENGETLDMRDIVKLFFESDEGCLLYTSPSPRDLSTSRMPSSA